MKKAILINVDGEWEYVCGEWLAEDNNSSQPDPPHPFLYKTGKLWMNSVALET